MFTGCFVLFLLSRYDIECLKDHLRLHSFNWSAVKKTTKKNTNRFRISYYFIAVSYKMNVSADGILNVQT